MTRKTVTPGPWIAVAIALAAGPACGQALDLTFDLNTPASQAPVFHGGEPPDVDAALAFNLGYYSRYAFADGPALRMGLVAGRQELKLRPAGSSVVWTRYSAYSLQARGDLRIAANSRWQLSGGIGFGLSFMSDNRPCNTLFCDLPESVCLITPSLRNTVRISSGVAAILEVKGAVYLNDRPSTYPYESGAIVALGLEFSARRPAGRPARYIAWSSPGGTGVGR